jgi:hypothetical protein
MKLVKMSEKQTLMVKGGWWIIALVVTFAIIAGYLLYETITK